MKKKKKWSLYILRCKDGRLYTGITNNLERRFKQHSSGKGARFTKCFGVDKLLYSEEVGKQSAAMVREAEVKTWPKTKKLDLAGISDETKKPRELSNNAEAPRRQNRSKTQKGGTCKEQNLG
ncbi:MAG: GIY-YIG nuclease family protein [Elusimicrobiota bacterium]